MAVVVKKVVECDHTACANTKDLETWTLVDPTGARKKVELCSKHSKPLNTLWEALEPAKKPRQALKVYGTLEEIPRV